MLFATVLLPGAARAWCQLTTEQGSPDDPQACAEVGTPLSWRRDQISYSFQEAGARDLPRSVVETTFAAAFDAWTDVDCGGLGVDFDVRQWAEDTVCDRPFHATDDPNSHAIVFASDWTSRGYPPEALANTTIWFGTRSGMILDVDMEYNQQNRTFVVCEGPAGCTAPGETDLPSVATHEAGHFFGLGHSDVADATMFPSTRPGSVMLRTLAEDDVEGMCTIYGGLDLPASGFEPRNGFTPDCPSGTDDGGCAAADAGPAGRLAWIGIAALVIRLRRRASFS